MFFFQAKMADKLITHGVAAPKEGNIKSFYVLFRYSYILSYVFRNKLFYVSDVLINQIRVRLRQISFQLHVHVVCSPFLSRDYFIKTFKIWN